MNKSVSSFAARSWRDIPQEVAPRSMSREGRRRMNMSFVKVGAVVAALGCVGWGAWEVLQTWQDNPTKLAAPVKSEPLKTITLRTDGVLDRAWVEKALALPKGVTLMELTLPALQQRLLADGQVRTAVLTRKFPDTLVVTLQERSPVGRLRAADANGAPRDFVVARDGVVFAGTNFDPPMVAMLPWLDGVKLVRTANGFEPLGGMETVADLFVTAQANVPHLYRNWRIVSLERLALDGEIVVRASDVKEIIFGLRDDFFSQVALLDAVITEAHAQPDRPIASINLALGTRQVPVAFEPVVTPAPISAPQVRLRAGSPATATRSDRPAPPPPYFTFQPSSPRKTSRDL